MSNEPGHCSQQGSANAANNDQPEKPAQVTQEPSAESAADTLDSPRSGGMPQKKARTRSPASAFMIPASPPRFVSFEQLMAAADTVYNMALAHEITVDNDFRLEKYESPEKSLERQVKETMYRAFWGILREKLSANPPDYSHALVLLEEVKESLIGMLLPNQDRVRAHIDEHLDLALIRQQLEKGVFELRGYADFIIGMMAKLCAPVRDALVGELKQIEDPIDLYKEIFRVLDLMKMDMANFTIAQMRPYIQQQAVTYERMKFGEFLQVQRNVGVDGLLITRKWLRQAYERLVLRTGPATAPTTGTGPGSVVDVGGLEASRAGERMGSQERALTPNNILSEAYMDLLEWDTSETFPETLVMDELRLTAMAETLRRLVLVCSLILITCNMAGPTVIAQHRELKLQLKDHLSEILTDVHSSKYLQFADSLADQMVVELETCLGAPLPDDKRALLRHQVKDSMKADNAVYKLIQSRSVDFVRRTIHSEHREPLQIPAGLSAVESELSSLCGQLLRILAHNRNVFSPYYTEILQQLLHNTSENEEHNDVLDELGGAAAIQ